MTDQTQPLIEAVTQAHESGRPLTITGSASKSFLGESVAADAAHNLDITKHAGIVSYDPGELILTARAGTPLAEIERALSAEGQALAFEPPHFGPGATLGGTLAAGVSGPARPWAGAARDFVLGSRIINGRGEALRFGGEVMKNVAGYDLSRLMVGAFGTLGVMLEASLKVLPRPRFSCTLCFAFDQAEAIEQFSEWGMKPWPITAAYWEDGCAYVRLAGAESSVQAAHQALGGELVDGADAFWADVREQRRPLLAQPDRPLWRLSVAPATPPLDLAGETVLDWRGAQRWLVSDQPAETIRTTVAAHGGHADIWRGAAGVPWQHPLPVPLVQLQKRLKQSLDPAGIFNAGRLHPEF